MAASATRPSPPKVTTAPSPGGCGGVPRLQHGAAALLGRRRRQQRQRHRQRSTDVIAGAEGGGGGEQGW